ncbi:2-phosphosulfolactate phosphatase [Ancylothrix sp. C2]|uniref:2-phosphosulfolactate phosphatase n=1 Tax=Ancylothrix sp. D3o TaxID=2953691 RepID=UPI0021BB7A49|nr:2-phosphosulfolactate phosphatase [Ancylothrix sp. D3o]MCT7948682.1 2-phosphosulfolactate phosphatase [Ancylothrix sp. D3o]
MKIQNHTKFTFEYFIVSGSQTPGAYTAKTKHIDESLLSDTAIVFTDVIRTATTLVAAGAAGCKAIELKVKPKTEEYNLTPSVLPDLKWFYGGEENGNAIFGGNIRNSPLSIYPSQLEGNCLQFFSTNGARALAAITHSSPRAVYMMCEPNVEVTMKELISKSYQRISFVGGGLYDSACVEDNYCCGRAIQYLLDSGYFYIEQINDEARIMLNFAKPYLNNLDLLIQTISNSYLGKLLGYIDRSEDIAASIRGDGVQVEVWNRMQNTIMQLQWFGNVPLFIPRVL